MSLSYMPFPDSGHDCFTRGDFGLVRLAVHGVVPDHAPGPLPTVSTTRPIRFRAAPLENIRKKSGGGNQTFPNKRLFMSPRSSFF